MELEETLAQINKISSSSESIFLELGNLFPSLLNKEGGTALQSLEKMLSTLSTGNTEASKSEKEFFNDYGTKYTPLFDKLNEKITDLGKLDKMIAEIKEDSEQMELIALNAMVISIKSGEKGQAFSRITENLQRLSNDMFLFSDKLSEEEGHLLEFINTLKSIFSGIIDSQKKLSTEGSSSSAEIRNLISTVSLPLSEMESDVDEIYLPIQKAMEGLQLQDIIRQSLEHVQSCIKEICKPVTSVPGSDEELDFVSFNIALYELACDVLKDINKHVNKSSESFDTNWNEVIELLDKIENEKNDFEKRFLAEYTVGSENIDKHLSKSIEEFKKMLEEFNNYHVVQKDLLHTTQNITARARTIYAVFDNLRPVMSRLHHVRILQQIEVSKNDAIKSVQDSVTDMDNLINSANESLDVMQTLLENFITDTSTMISTFTESINKDNNNMIILKDEKLKFFEEMKVGKNTLSSIIQDFTVFPEGFQQKCVVVQQNLQNLRKMSTNINQFVEQLKESQQELIEKKEQMLQERNISEWNIKNSQFSELINHFTITAHKEVAGKLGGFNIEKGSESGEITLF